MSSFSSLYYEKALNMLREVCTIPSPSHHEEKRAEFIIDYLRKEGIDGAYIDEAKNVIIPYNDDGKCPLDVFAAHTDVVFADEESLPMKEEGDYLYCPGAGDDTAQFVALVMYAIHYHKEKVSTKRGILFVCNSCEEGLGNLKGVKKLFETYSGRIRTFTTFDACLGSGIVNTSVGSERYKIKVRTQGGHSYKNFGADNAIHIISLIISELYKKKVNDKTTYNVGTISGGTSVNTIAESAECLYEFRSTDKASLSAMRSYFTSLIASFKEKYDVSYEEVGIRPCSSILDNSRLERLADAVMEKHGLSKKKTTSSTDANIPLSVGIPALCIGLVELEGAHTRNEVINIKSYEKGLDVGFDYIKMVTEDE